LKEEEEEEEEEKITNKEKKIIYIHIHIMIRTFEGGCCLFLFFIVYFKGYFFYLESTLKKSN